MKKEKYAGMKAYLKKVKARIDKAKEIKKAGGNAYEQLEARLTDEDTGKLIQDIVITAIMDLKTAEDAKSFYQGYTKNITENLSKYPKQAKEMGSKAYAKYDIELALNLHFTSPKTHKLWNSVLT